MKSQFKHYYPLIESEMDKLWSDCLFVFDTNVLLSIYKMSDKTRDWFFRILEHVWMLDRPTANHRLKISRNNQKTHRSNQMRTGRRSSKKDMGKIQIVTRRKRVFTEFTAHTSAVDLLTPDWRKPRKLSEEPNKST